MRIILLCCFFLWYNQTSACLNFYGLDSNGQVHNLEGLFLQTIQFDPRNIQKNINELNRQFERGDYHFKNVSDYGAYLLMGGRFNEGLIIFRGLVTKYPAEYAIKANLAVAYELNGKIDSALFWERQAYAQNPGSHSHSEWVHLKLLESKLSFQHDSSWLQNNRVSSIKDSLAKYDDSSRQSTDVNRIFGCFIRQIDQRLPFTIGKDEVFGKMMFELGDAYINYSVYRAYYCYVIAKYFNPSLEEKVNKNILTIRNIYKNLDRSKYSIKEFSHKEMFPPTESEVAAFISRLNQRRDLYQSNLQVVDLQDLLAKANEIVPSKKK